MKERAKGLGLDHFTCRARNDRNSRGKGFQNIFGTRFEDSFHVGLLVEVRSVIWGMNRHLDGFASFKSARLEQLLQCGWGPTDCETVRIDSANVWLGERRKALNLSVPFTFHTRMKAHLRMGKFFQAGDGILFVKASNHDRPTRHDGRLLADAIPDLHGTETCAESDQDGFNGSWKKIGNSL